jgi:hypothetical protein
VSAPAGHPRSAFQRWWPVLANVVVVLWLTGLLVVFFHADVPVWHLIHPDHIPTMRLVLFWVFPFFVLNLWFQFRWSGLGPREFARKRWLDILMVVPVFRALQFIRLFRLGMLGFVVRAAHRVRSAIQLSRRARRSAKKAAKVVKAKAALSQAHAVDVEPGTGSAEPAPGQ